MLHLHEIAQLCGRCTTLLLPLMVRYSREIYVCRKDGKMTLMGTNIAQVRESNRTESPPGSPFQRKGLDETERKGGVQLTE